MTIPCFKQDHFTTVVQMEHATADLRSLAPLAEQLNVTVGLETLLSGTINQYLIEGVGSSRVRIYCVTSSTMNYGRDPFAELPKLAPVIGRHHSKDARGTLGYQPEAHGHKPTEPIMKLGDGALDLPAWIQAIRATGHDDWLILETSPASGDLLAEARHNAHRLCDLVAAHVAV